MKIPQELKDYKYNKIRYNNFLEELEVLKARATKITTVLSDMPKRFNRQ